MPFRIFRQNKYNGRFILCRYEYSTPEEALNNMITYRNPDSDVWIIDLPRGIYVHGFTYMKELSADFQDTIENAKLCGIKINS
jgi:hypothetical protein